MSRQRGVAELIGAPKDEDGEQASGEPCKEKLRKRGMRLIRAVQKEVREELHEENEWDEDGGVFGGKS
jgi:hypothetical protein